MKKFNFNAYNIIDSIFMNRVEKKISQLLLKKNLLEKELIIFDVGCYRGLFSQRLHNHLKKINTNLKFYLFDPNPNVKRYLEEDLKFNYNFNEIALDNTPGLKELYFNNFLEHSGTSLKRTVYDDKKWVMSRKLLFFKMSSNFSIFKVKVNTLNHFCLEKKISKIDILKLDTDGNELNILEGSNQMIKNCSIIYIEILESRDKFEKKFDLVKKIMINENFILLEVKKILSSQILSNIKCVDCLFINKKLI